MLDNELELMNPPRITNRVKVGLFALLAISDGIRSEPFDSTLPQDPRTRRERAKIDPEFAVRMLASAICKCPYIRRSLKSGKWMPPPGLRGNAYNYPSSSSTLASPLLCSLAVNRRLWSRNDKKSKWLAKRKPSVFLISCDHRSFRSERAKYGEIWRECQRCEYRVQSCLPALMAECGCGGSVGLDIGWKAVRKGREESLTIHIHIVLEHYGDEEDPQLAAKLLASVKRIWTESKSTSSDEVRCHVEGPVGSKKDVKTMIRYAQGEKIREGVAMSKLLFQCLSLDKANGTKPAARPSMAALKLILAFHSRPSAWSLTWFGVWNHRCKAGRRCLANPKKYPRNSEACCGLFRAGW